MAWRHEDGLRAAPERLGAAHRRLDPEVARLVVRRGDDAPSARVAADDERYAAKARILELLDRREEGVQIEMGDDHAWVTPMMMPPVTISTAPAITWRPTSSRRPRTIAASRTPNSASVATSGLTTVTRAR